MNLNCKLDNLQRGDQYMETSVALCEIRTQLQELTKSVESCQSEVSEVENWVTFLLFQNLFQYFFSSLFSLFLFLSIAVTIQQYGNE